MAFSDFYVFIGPVGYDNVESAWAHKLSSSMTMPSYGIQFT